MALRSASVESRFEATLHAGGLHERIYERDLNPNLLATQRGSGGQSRNLVERTGEPGTKGMGRQKLKRPWNGHNS
jgi:hypothetical protein